MRCERRDGLAVITLEAGRANAMGPAFLDGLARLLDEAEGCRALLLTGYARYFSAGLALPELIDYERPAMRAFIRRFNALMLRVYQLPCPTVAAINGHAVAGGCVLAEQCDVRLMAEGRGRIGLSEVSLGVGLPGAVLETVRSRIPHHRLPVVALEGQLFLPGAALEHGLVDEVLPAGALLERATARARQLSDLAGPAYAQIKRAHRAPIVSRIAAGEEADTEAWLDTWFSPKARERIAQLIADLG